MIHPQWQFNGQDLPGETKLMLSRTNFDSRFAGDYQLILTRQRLDRSSTVTKSSVATLIVTNAETPPFLEISSLSLNRWTVAFGGAGDAERAYRVLSSSDLFSWAPQNIFGSNSVFRVQAGKRLEIPIDHGQAFLRLESYLPHSDNCINHLRQIRWAKKQWSLERHHAPGLATLDAEADDLMSYDARRCPSGGYYTYDRLGTDPVCSIPSEFLEEIE